MNDNLKQRQILRAERLAAEAAAHRDRRERIATAAMVGLIYKFGDWNRSYVCARRAIEYADALIEVLDKEAQP